MKLFAKQRHITYYSIAFERNSEDEPEYVEFIDFIEKYGAVWQHGFVFDIDKEPFPIANGWQKFRDYAIVLFWFPTPKHETLFHIANTYDTCDRSFDLSLMEYFMSCVDNVSLEFKIKMHYHHTDDGDGKPSELMVLKKYAWERVNNRISNRFNSSLRRLNRAAKNCPFPPPPTGFRKKQ